MACFCQFQRLFTKVKLCVDFDDWRDTRRMVEMACFCQFQRLFPKVKLCVDFDDWRDTRRMVEIARREEEHKKRGTKPPNYDCAGLSDMSDEEEPVTDDEEETEGTSKVTASVSA